MTERPLPPGWPSPVLPPGAPDWERSAVAWLLDQSPPEYRGHPALTRHPAALAWLAGHHVDGGLAAVRRALAGARTDLGSVLPAPAMSALLETLQAEQVRLIGVRRAVGLVGEALQGRRHVPRL
jgi:hypothetical protein